MLSEQHTHAYTQKQSCNATRSRLCFSIFLKDISTWGVIEDCKPYWRPGLSLVWCIQMWRCGYASVKKHYVGIIKSGDLQESGSVSWSKQTRDMNVINSHSCCCWRRSCKWFGNHPCDSSSACRSFSFTWWRSRCFPRATSDWAGQSDEGCSS